MKWGGKEDLAAYVRSQRQPLGTLNLPLVPCAHVKHATNP